MRSPSDLGGSPSYCGSYCGARRYTSRALCAWLMLSALHTIQACGESSEGSEPRDQSEDPGTANSGSGNSGGGASGATTSGGSTSGANTSNGAMDEDGGSNAPSVNEGDTYYRADVLKLLKPKLVLKPLGFETDITGDAQKAEDEGLKADKEPDDGDGVADSGDGDGYVDLNAIIKFIGGVDPKEAGGFVTAGAGLCPYPYDASKVCGPLKLGPFQEAASYTHGKDCKLDGASGTASGSCFSSQQGAFTVNIQLIGAVPLENTQVIGAWVDEARGGISNGWIRGFLSEEVAKKTKLPEQLPIAARLLGIAPNTPLIDFLSDGDKQAAPAGWWFTLQYTAKPALYDPKVGPDGEK